MARVGNQEIGTVAYNGFEFKGAYHIDVNSMDQLDTAGRTVIYTAHTLTVRAVLADAANTDAEMQAIHLLLSKQGGTLVLTTKGFGSPLVLTPASNDVLFGPIPKVLSWRPLGANRACQITWQCTFHTVECGSSKPLRGALAANYSVSIGINNHGDTTRTIAGYVQVANSRIGRIIVQNPENFRTFIHGRVPLGFKREQRYQFNEAKNRVDFTLIDTKIPTHHNAYPIYMVEADGEHTISWSANTRRRLHNTLRFTLTPRADISQTECWIVALHILDEKMRVQRDAKNDKGKPSTTLVKSFDIKEDLWGRPVSMSFSWWHLHCINDFIKDSGLFKPLPETSGSGVGTWEQWRKAMESWAHFAYGNDEWRLGANDDKVIDLCGGQTPLQINDKVLNWNIQARVPIELSNQVPEAQNSMIDFGNNILTNVSRASVQQAILQQPDQQTGTDNLLLTSFPDFGNGGNSISAVLQQAGSGLYQGFVRGFAIRAGHPVPKPNIQQVGSQVAVETAGSFQQAVVDNLLGIPIYRAAWSIVYMLKNAPGIVKPLPNFGKHTDSDGNACGPKKKG
jgi:hypothetical protein